MTTIIDEKRIMELVQGLDLPALMAEGFIAFSNGNAVVPPVGELLLEKGETHIKYGYIKQKNFYTIKVASGFYDNPKLGLPSSQGLMLLFSQETGELAAILLDNGKLTDLRTAAAGALVAKHFAPKSLKGVGILGTGTQAKLQLESLLREVNVEDVWVWGRNRKRAEEFQKDFHDHVNIAILNSPAEVANHANLIVTATPSEVPLLNAKDISKGTHITAVGSDTRAKQELSSDLLAKASLLISDSLSQSRTRGEVFKARASSAISSEDVIELGTALQNPKLQRADDSQITIVDLTGVAVQDIMIAEAVYRKHIENN